VACFGACFGGSVARAQQEGDAFEAGYSVGFRYLILTDRYLTPQGQLKPFDEMTPPQIGTLYHEMWHAWLATAAFAEAPDFLRRFRADAGMCHVDVPADDRVEVHEEAAADYIEALVSTYVQMNRFLAGKTPERREEIRKQGRYLESYRHLFTDRFTGYYTEEIAGATSATAHLEDFVTSGSRTAHSGASATSATAVRLADATTSQGLVHSIHGNPAEFLARFISGAHAQGLPTRYLTQAAEQLRAVAVLRSTGEGTGLTAEVHWSVWPLRGSDLIFIERDLLEGRFAMDPNVVFSESRFTTATVKPGGASKEGAKP
jgi:hypothetical protein